MRKPPFALSLALALSPFPASAASDPALEPLAFLVGHCWIGTIPGTADTDEHCFAWVYEGRYLRDRHVVRRGEKAVYEGEDACEVLREYGTDKGWAPVKMQMKKVERK